MEPINAIAEETGSSNNGSLVAPLSPEVEIPGVSPESEAENAAITLAQNKPQAGETGGSCNLDGQKCINVDDCCGNGINELGGT